MSFLLVFISVKETLTILMLSAGLSVHKNILGPNDVDTLCGKHDTNTLSGNGRTGF